MVFQMAAKAAVVGVHADEMDGVCVVVVMI